MSDFYLNANSDNEQIIRNIGRAIRALSNDKRWHIKIKLFRKNRTLEQQAYYWSVVLPTIASWFHESAGELYTEDAWHETLKPIYVPCKVENGPDGEIKIYKSTTKLSTTEYNTMFDQIVSDFADKGCHIPPPDKQWKTRKAA